jgi:hypothetical protein
MKARQFNAFGASVRLEKKRRAVNCCGIRRRGGGLMASHAANSHDGDDYQMMMRQRNTKLNMAREEGLDLKQPVGSICLSLKGVPNFCHFLRSFYCRISPNSNLNSELRKKAPLRLQLYNPKTVKLYQHKSAQQAAEVHMCTTTPTASCSSCCCYRRCRRVADASVR